LVARYGWGWLGYPAILRGDTQTARLERERRLALPG